jgi:CheY-like chemotaxis protein
MLVCEDNLHMQRGFAEWACRLLPPEGWVQCSFVCGGVMAAAILQAVMVDVLVLDHDMPLGDGGELLKWMTDALPQERWPLVVTASGIPINNERLRNLGAHLVATKNQVMAGAFDEEILARMPAA